MFSYSNPRIRVALGLSGFLIGFFGILFACDAMGFTYICGSLSLAAGIVLGIIVFFLPEIKNLIFGKKSA